MRKLKNTQEYWKLTPSNKWITATKNNTDNVSTNRTTITRKQKWEEKQLYGRFNLLSNISHEKTWMSLRIKNFNRETESLLIATQNNAIKKHSYQSKDG